MSFISAQRPCGSMKLNLCKEYYTNPKHCQGQVWIARVKFFVKIFKLTVKQNDSFTDLSHLVQYTITHWFI